jgi:ArsR family transcriptional regulator
MNLQDKKTKQLFKQRSEIIKALAHPTRLFVVTLLEEKPYCVCELTALIDADISTVSRHLATLRNAGIISDERRGNQIWYHLETPCVLGFINCVDNALSGKTNQTINQCSCCNSSMSKK